MYRLIILLLCFVFISACNPCLFATISCDYAGYRYKGNDIGLDIKDNMTEEERLIDLKNCIAISCPDVYKIYNLPDNKGNYMSYIREKYKNDYRQDYITSSYMAEKCIGDIGICMKNKGYKSID